MTDSLVAAYRKGAITADHLVARCLSTIDPQSPGPTLEPLPEELIARVREYAHRYRAGTMVTNYGTPPSAEQVEAARRWIEEERGCPETPIQPGDADRDSRRRAISQAAPPDPGRDDPAHRPSRAEVSHHY
ncbi:MAG: hypothetical protein ACYC61_04100 [Isosphaeraceae bacterium]